MSRRRAKCFVVAVLALALVPAVLIGLHLWSWLAFAVAATVATTITIGVLVVSRSPATVVIPIAALYTLALFTVSALLVPRQSAAWISVDLQSCSTITLAAVPTSASNSPAALKVLLYVEGLIFHGGQGSPVLTIGSCGSIEPHQLGSAGESAGAVRCHIRTAGGGRNSLAVAFVTAGEMSEEMVWPDGFSISASCEPSSASEDGSCDVGQPPAWLEIYDWAIVVPLARSPLRIAASSGNMIDVVFARTGGLDDLQMPVSLPPNDLRTWRTQFFRSNRMDASLELTLDTAQCIVFGGSARVIGESGDEADVDSPFYAQLVGATNVGLQLSVPPREMLILTDASSDEHLTLASADPAGNSIVACNLSDAAGGLKLSGESHALDGASLLGFSCDGQIELISNGDPLGVEARRLLGQEIFVGDTRLGEGVLWSRLPAPATGVVMSLLTGVAMLLLGRWASARSRSGRRTGNGSSRDSNGTGRT
ncbi:hypothetical protein ACFLTM_01330 [Candidatus Bipolaricaulota bacterium]